MSNLQQLKLKLKRIIVGWNSVHTPDELEGLDEQGLRELEKATIPQLLNASLPEEEMDEWKRLFELYVAIGDCSDLTAQVCEKFGFDKALQGGLAAQQVLKEFIEQEEPVQ